MREFFKKLTGNSKKSFREIPTDREATYKQRWAVAWQFARECAEEFPDVSSKGLAVVFNAVILKYHSDPKNNSKLTHGDVQAYLGGDKKCPEYYKSLIDMKPQNGNIRNSGSHSNQGKFDFSDDKQVQKFIKMYKEGHTLSEMGETFGVSVGTVSNYAKRLKDQGEDIELRGQGSNQANSWNPSDEITQRFIEMYNEGHSLTDIGKTFDVSRWTVSSYAKRLKDQGADIELRDQDSQANILNLSDERAVRRFIKMYNDGYTLGAIGETFKMSVGSVRNYVKRLKERGVDIEFRGMGTRTDNKYPHNKRPKIVKEENASNKKLLNIMNSQKRR